jgi:hypothetical protein
LLDLLLYLEDGGRPFLRNIGELLPDYAASHPQKIFRVTDVRTPNTSM